MPDALFADPRLAPLYDLFDDDRSDLAAYVAIVAELEAERVLDVGCGTGTFAVLLASRGLEVVGVDPALASLEIAQRKPGAEGVRWLHGDATSLPPLAVDVAVMTGNVAQAIVEPVDWSETLNGICAALRPGGFLIFETRDPSRRAWEEWTPAATRRVVELCGGRSVERRHEVTEIRPPLVTFTTTFAFSDGDVLTSRSTLRFRERGEIEADLVGHGYELLEVRDAPDRPGREFVFLVRWPGG